MDLYFLHYNNYYNRIIKKFDTLSEYLVAPYYDNCVIQGVAFNPNDSVETEQILNSSTGTYDYVIVANGTTIDSRWFIMESKRMRNNQYKVHLRHDMFADSYAGILSAPAFIEKATLLSEDPMIFNKEDMTYNQIKTSETLLKDETGCPWIVGYIARKKNDGTDMNYDVTTELTSPLTQTVTNLSDWSGYSYYNQNKPFLGPIQNFLGMIRYNYEPQAGTKYWEIFNQNGYYNTEVHEGNIDYGIGYIDDGVGNSWSGWQTYAQNVLAQISSVVDAHTQSQFDAIASQNGQFIKVTSTNKTYQVSISSTTITKTLQSVTSNNTPNLFNTFKTALNPLGIGTPNNYSFGYSIYDVPAYNITLTEVVPDEYSVSIPTARYHLDKVPYDMFAIPYADGLSIKKNGVVHCNSTSKEIAIAIANAFSIKYTGAGFVYDIQLLPYCPVRFNIQSNGEIDAIGDNATYGMFDITNNDNDVVGEVFIVNSDSFSFNISLASPITITNPKVQSECDMYRLCSPNYNGVFEFNASKNGGISYFNVDCTYKPYNPYIHLNPNFSKLYGQDFNDSRGLVCGGEFSFPQTTSEWTTYELNNKNYQNSFNRQIENMEVNNNIQNIKTATSLVTGTIGGIMGGAMSGGIVGGILGGTASAVGGAMDYALQKASQAEAIDYTKDQFGYNLGNIKARTTSIAKTTAFTYNNKLFPFLEYYTCTDEEKQALEDKIRYNGMTVMRIGTIAEFLKNDYTYIKGKFIRIENVDEDFHYINELANEFNKGVFIK